MELPARTRTCASTSRWRCRQTVIRATRHVDYRGYRGGQLMALPRDGASAPRVRIRATLRRVWDAGGGQAGRSADLPPLLRWHHQNGWVGHRGWVAGVQSVLILSS